jgi:hypothetical protein
MSHATGIYNVEASLVAWLAKGLATNAAPLAANALLLYDSPEQPLEAPCYAVHFLGDTEDDAVQGRNVGEGKHGGFKVGLMQVTAYVTRENNSGWRGQLNQMIDAITATYWNTTNSAIIIKDFYTDADTPTDTAYRIVLLNHYRAPEPMIQNPDFEQRGINIMYQYVERM